MKKRIKKIKPKTLNEDLYVRINSIEDCLSRISTQIDSIKTNMYLVNCNYSNLVEILKKSIYELEKAKADYKIASLEEPSLKLPKDYKPFSSF